MITDFNSCSQQLLVCSENKHSLIIVQPANDLFLPRLNDHQEEKGTPTNMRYAKADLFAHGL